MQGSASVVRAMVKRSRLAFTGGKRSIFRRGFTDARKKRGVSDPGSAGIPAGLFPTGVLAGKDAGAPTCSTNAIIEVVTSASAAPLRSTILFELDNSQTPPSENPL